MCRRQKWRIVFVVGLATLSIAGCGSTASPDAAVDASLTDTTQDVADSTTDASIGPDAAPAICSQYDEPIELGRVMNPDVEECSGVVASRDHPGVYWVHNDSGDSPRVFALNEEGVHLAELVLQDAEHHDWEDMTIDSRPDADWLYVGDIGDNGRRREELQIYRFAEPALTPTTAPMSISVSSVEHIRVRYPDGEAYNAESLAIDPRTQDLFIMTKDDGGASLLFRLSGPVEALTEPQTLERVASLQINREGVIATHATAMDISPSGDRILLRTYFEVLQWARPAGTTVAMAIGNPRLLLPSPPERQGEAIAFSADGLAYLTISEGMNPTVYRCLADESCRPDP